MAASILAYMTGWYLGPSIIGGRFLNRETPPSPFLRQSEQREILNRYLEYITEVGVITRPPEYVAIRNAPMRHRDFTFSSCGNKVPLREKKRLLLPNFNGHWSSGCYRANGTSFVLTFGKITGGWNSNLLPRVFQRYFI